MDGKAPKVRALAVSVEISWAGLLGLCLLGDFVSLLFETVVYDIFWDFLGLSMLFG